MNPSTRNSLVGVGVIAAVTTIALIIPSTNPPPPTKFLYPRRIKPLLVNEAEWSKRMASEARTNIPGTKLWIKVSK